MVRAVEKVEGIRRNRVGREQDERGRGGDRMEGGGQGTC